MGLAMGLCQAAKHLPASYTSSAVGPADHSLKHETKLTKTTKAKNTKTSKQTKQLKKTTQQQLYKKTKLTNATRKL